MRVLFLCHPEADYGGYCLYNGLCEVLGPESITDFPYKRSYHGETHHYPSFYQDHDVRFEGTMFTTAADGTKMGLTGPFDWTVARPGKEHTLDEIRDLCKASAFDLVVCESTRQTVIQMLRALKDVLPPKIVVHDGEDYSQIARAHIGRSPVIFGADLIRDFGVKLYLKRELLQEEIRAVEDLGCRVKPFPFSSVIHQAPAEQERDIDILCSIGMSIPKRAKIKALVEQMAGEGYRVETSHAKWTDWIERIGRARICVAPRGFGQDTLRRWEVPAAGALMMQERLDLVEENPFRNGVHCVHYSPDAHDFEVKVRAWLADETSRARVARAGQMFLFEHHTNAARARQMLGWVKETWG